MTHASLASLRTAHSSSADLEGLARMEKRHSAAGSESPSVAESKEGIQESLKLSFGSTATSPESNPCLASPGKEEGTVRKGLSITPFSPCAIDRQIKLECGNGVTKDTSLTNSSPAEFKSPACFPASPFLVCTSAFQRLRGSQPGMDRLHRTISSMQHLPDNSPCAPSSQIPVLRPIVRIPAFYPVPTVPATAGSAIHRATLTAASAVVRQPVVIKIDVPTGEELRGKRPAPEDMDEGEVVGESPDGEIFECKHCHKRFLTGQALGGHMSRKHSGKSDKYNYKKDVRKRREFERMKLLLAKKRYFASLGFDYDELLKTPRGKLQAKLLINRSRIKKLKSTLTDEEVYNFFDNQ